MLECISNSPANLLADSISHKTSHALQIISGPRGCGKTTCCTQIAAQIQAAGLSVGGLICPAVFEGEKKVAIEQVDLYTGQQRRLGTRRESECTVENTPESTVGCWQMDASVLAWGNAILAGLGDEDLIIIDELGPLELKEGRGYHEGLRLLDEERYQMALVVVRPSLLALAQSRWPQAEVMMLEARPR